MIQKSVLLAKCSALHWFQCHANEVNPQQAARLALALPNPLIRKPDELSCRFNRYVKLNLSEATIQAILSAYPEANLDEFLLEDNPFKQREQEQLYGEQLPTGLVAFF